MLGFQLTSGRGTSIAFAAVSQSELSKADRGAPDKPGLSRTVVADLVLASLEMERSLMLLRFGAPLGV